VGGTPDGVRRLATCVRAKQPEILEVWRLRITGDPSVPTARLSPLEIEDHVPELLGRIADGLEEFAKWRDDAEARAELAGRGSPAVQHFRVRTREGYDLSQVLRELHHLRDAIIDICEAELVNVGGDGARVVHGAIDAAMMVAALSYQKRSD
jgi:hypothetical protein